MNVTATLDGELVTIVGMSVDGSRLWIFYVDASDNLKIKKKSIRLTQANPFQVVATSATVN